MFAAAALAASVPLLAFPPPETRIACAALLALGFVQSLWNLYALALLGPLFLLNQGATPNIVIVDAMALGAIMGECRIALCGTGALAGLASRSTLDESGISSRFRPAGAPVPQGLCFGAWPAFLFCVLLLVAVSAMPGVLANMASERAGTGESSFVRTVRIAYFDWASSLEWSLRCVVNWSCAVGLAVVAARHASACVVRRFLRFAAAGFVAACAAGMLDRIAMATGRPFFSLAELRPSNFGWVEWKRLQATAGHAGWFGQWAVVAWPGLVLLWGGSKGRRLAVALSALLVLLCLLLGAARAALLAVFAGVAMWGAWMALGRRVSMRAVLAAAACAAAAAGIAAMIAGKGVLLRATEIFLFSNRANYVASGLVLRDVFPFGTGIGMHSPYYETWFTPLCRIYQADHLDCHNLFLHLLVENGPALPLLLLGGIVALGVQVLRAWRTLDAEAKPVALLLAAIVAGLLVNGLAQYLFYVRAVEFAFWIACGFLCGLTARALRPRTVPACVLILACGIYACFAARAHVARSVVDEYPRPLLRQPGADPVAWSQWTAKRWRHPIDPDVERIDFALFRLGTPCTATIAWPDGSRETVRLNPGELRRFSHPVDVLPDWGRYVGVRWMQIDVSTTYTPLKWDPNIPDPRPLGVNVMDLRLATRNERWLEQ